MAQFQHWIAIQFEHGLISDQCIQTSNRLNWARAFSCCCMEFFNFFSSSLVSINRSKIMTDEVITRNHWFGRKNSLGHYTRKNWVIIGIRLLFFVLDKILHPQFSPQQRGFARLPHISAEQYTIASYIGFRVGCCFIQCSIQKSWNSYNVQNYHSKQNTKQYFLGHDKLRTFIN